MITITQPLHFASEQPDEHRPFWSFHAEGLDKDGNSILPCYSGVYIPLPGWEWADQVRDLKVVSWAYQETKMTVTQKRLEDIKAKAQALLAAFLVRPELEANGDLCTAIEDALTQMEIASALSE